MTGRRRAHACAVAIVLLVGACTPADEPDRPDETPGEAAEREAPDGAAPDLGVVELVREFSPQTVAVEITVERRGRTGQGTGSGVIWSSDGVIVTNHHVVAPAEDIAVVLADGTRYEAELIASDPRTDIALLQIDATGLPAAEFADALPQIGELAVAIGNPLGFQNTATSGIVSGVDRSLPIVQGQPPLVGLIQTDAAISSGNSGGALVGADGRAMGINVAVVEGADIPGVAQGLGFAIPATTVTAVVEELLQTGEVQHAYLGIIGVGLTTQLAERFDIERDRGVLVGEVQPDSPADAAGLQQGDVIVRLEDGEIGDLGELLATLRTFDPGDEIEVGFVRGGEDRTSSAVLTELPDDEPLLEPTPPDDPLEPTPPDDPLDDPLGEG